MTDWTAKELDMIDAADELAIAPAGPDASLHPYTTIWVVRVGGDELYVRSYLGRRGSWFRHALQSHQGRVRAAGVERRGIRTTTTLTTTQSTRRYRSKYARYPVYVEPSVTEPSGCSAYCPRPGWVRADHRHEPA